MAKKGVGSRQLQGIIEEVCSEAEREGEGHLIAYSNVSSPQEWTKIKARLAKESSEDKIRHFLFAISEGYDVDRAFAMSGC